MSLAHGCGGARTKAHFDRHSRRRDQNQGVVCSNSFERGDTSRWPAGIFFRSHLRAYADAIGLDPDATVRNFSQRFLSRPLVRTQPRKSLAFIDGAAPAFSAVGRFRPSGGVRSVADGAVLGGRAFVHFSSSEPCGRRWRLQRACTTSPEQFSRGRRPACRSRRGGVVARALTTCHTCHRRRRSRQRHSRWRRSKATTCPRNCRCDNLVIPWQDSR